MVNRIIIMGRKKKLLFLCTGNSCRSQIAEGWGHVLLEEEFEIYSAGTHPMEINPGSIATMAEVGIDISSQRSKSTDEVPWEEMDVVITLCDNAKEVCPVPPPQAVILHWSIEDPFGPSSNEERNARYKKTREDIYKRIEEFKKKRCLKK